MKLQLDAVTQKWQKKARLFAEDELIPHEVEAEMNSGRLPRAVSQRHVVGGETDHLRGRRSP